MKEPARVSEPVPEVSQGVAKTLTYASIMATLQNDCQGVINESQTL